MREPAFGPVVASADEAPPLDRLLALTGRDPGWSADSALERANMTRGSSRGADVNQSRASNSEGSKLGGGAIATLVGLAVLVIFVVQNTEDVKFKFLFLDFTWPLWLYTIVVAVIGVLRLVRARRGASPSAAQGTPRRPSRLNAQPVEPPASNVMPCTSRMR